MKSKFKTFQFELTVKRTLKFNIEDLLEDFPELKDEKFLEENGIESEMDILNYMMETDLGLELIFDRTSRCIKGVEETEPGAIDNFKVLGEDEENEE
nr:MAG TPA: hypothetical protein [Caudoviricetes sp.]